MIHSLNSIYTPQGVSLASMMTFKPPALRHSSVVDVKPRSAAELKRIAKMQDAALVSLKDRTDARYANAFDGKPRTVTYLAKVLKISRQGVFQQLRKYAKTGAVIRGEAVPPNREVLWRWV